MATDISAAIDHGRRLVARAPFPTGRSIINLCVNGRDNVGDGPEAARDRAATQDVVINGVVLGEREGLASYFRESIQAGPGSFVIEARRQPDLTQAMLRKFVTEIAWRPAGRRRRPHVRCRLDWGCELLHRRVPEYGITISINYASNAVVCRRALIAGGLASPPPFCSEAS
jgi:Protein of unknown function (DUF1194)